MAQLRRGEELGDLCSPDSLAGEKDEKRCEGASDKGDSHKHSQAVNDRYFFGTKERMENCWFKETEEKPGHEPGQQIYSRCHGNQIDRLSFYRLCRALVQILDGQAPIGDWTQRTRPTSGRERNNQKYRCRADKKIDVVVNGRPPRKDPCFNVSKIEEGQQGTECILGHE